MTTSEPENACKGLPVWKEMPAFDARLRELGLWNTTGTSYLFDGTTDLIRLQHVIPGKRWCSEEGILTILERVRTSPIHPLDSIPSSA